MDIKFKLDTRGKYYKKYKGGKMAKKTKLLDWLMWVVGIIVSLGVAGLFWDGTMANVIILKMLPLLVHQIVAISIYATTLLAVLKKIGIMR